MSSLPALALAPLPKSQEAPIRLSVVLPAMDETWSLRETVERIEETNRADVQEYIIVVCKHTTKECRETAEELRSQSPERVLVLEQKLPFLGGAVRDAFSVARGSHVVLMGSDLETDPATLPLMVDQAKRHAHAVITATRLKDGVRFEGYSRVKLVLNRIFQRLFAALYGVRLTDLTFAYRILPTSLVQSIRWEELKHPFLFETVVKPLQLGIEVIEVPSQWKKRGEGTTHNPFLTNFLYFRIGLKTRFSSRRNLLIKTT